MADLNKGSVWTVALIAIGLAVVLLILKVLISIVWTLLVLGLCLAAGVTVWNALQRK